MSTLTPPPPPPPPPPPSRSGTRTVERYGLAIASFLVFGIGGLLVGDLLTSDDVVVLPELAPIEIATGWGAFDDALAIESEDGSTDISARNQALDHADDPARDAARDQMADAATEGSGGANPVAAEFGAIPAFLADPPVLVGDAGMLPDFFAGGAPANEAAGFSNLLGDLVLEPVATRFSDLCADPDSFVAGAGPGACPEGIAALILGSHQPPPFEIRAVYTTPQAWGFFDCAPLVDDPEQAQQLVVVTTHPASFTLRHGAETQQVPGYPDDHPRNAAWSEALENDRPILVGHCIVVRPVPRGSFDYVIVIDAESAITDETATEVFQLDLPAWGGRPPVEVSLLTGRVATVDHMLVGITIPFRSSQDPQDVRVAVVEPDAGDSCRSGAAIADGGDPLLGPTPYDPGQYDARYDRSVLNLVALQEGSTVQLCVWWMRNGEIEDREMRTISTPDLRRYRMTFDAVTLRAETLGLEFVMDANWPGPDCTAEIRGTATPIRTSVRRSFGLPMCDNGGGQVPAWTVLRVIHPGCIAAGAPLAACSLNSPPIPTPAAKCSDDSPVGCSDDFSIAFEFPFHTALYDPDTVGVTGVSMTGGSFLDDCDSWDEYMTACLGFTSNLPPGPEPSECVARSEIGACLDMHERPWHVGTAKIIIESYDDPDHASGIFGFLVGPPIDFAGVAIDLGSARVELAEPFAVDRPNIRVSFTADRPVTGQVRLIPNLDGPLCGAPASIQLEEAAATHDVVFEGACTGTAYRVALDLSDESGNRSTYAKITKDFALDVDREFAFSWAGAGITTPFLLVDVEIDFEISHRGLSIGDRLSFERLEAVMGTSIVGFRGSDCVQVGSRTQAITRTAALADPVVFAISRTASANARCDYAGDPFDTVLTNLQSYPLHAVLDGTVDSILFSDADSDMSIRMFIRSLTPTR